MKRGISMNEQTTDRIVIALEEKQTATIENIRRWLNDTYKESYSWNTIRKHLDKLIERKQVIEEVISDEKRKVSVFRIIV